MRNTESSWKMLAAMACFAVAAILHTVRAVLILFGY